MDNRTKLISKIESIDKNLSPDEKKKLVTKMAKIIEEPNFVIIDEIENMSSKLEIISGIISSINSKEVTEYGNELATLIESLDLIKQSIIDKETVINIPLDELSNSINKVEKAIKEIKEVKIPEFPTSISVDNSFDIEILQAIKEIPEFPVKELAKLVTGIEDKISNIKFEVPEFDYTRIEKKLTDIVSAVKKINLTVYGGGNSIVGIRNSSSTQINPATEEKQDDIVTAIQNITIPAPIGSATETKQDTMIGLIDELEPKLDTLIGKDFATATKQQTSIDNESIIIANQGDIKTSLISIDTKVTEIPVINSRVLELVTYGSKEDKQDTIITKLTNITDGYYVSSNIDMVDATYYYFLSFIPGTTKWRINRLNKTSYVSDYTIGDSSISTAWTDRATQTYATIY